MTNYTVSGIVEGWRIEREITAISIQHAIKVFIFGFMGFNFSEYVYLIFIMIITGFIGTLLGKNILINYGQKYFKIFLNSILTFISIYLIVNGLINY